MSVSHPQLENPAIVDAIFEMRFDASEEVFPDLMMGQMIANPEWKDFKRRKLPIYEVPESIRRNEAGLRHQPILQLVSEDGLRVIGIGPEVITTSRLGDYPGWDSDFRDEIHASVNHFSKVREGERINRIGLRFVNALRNDLHDVSGIADLELNVDFAGTKIEDRLNINFVNEVSEDLESMARISTLDFAQGKIPEGTTVVLDIDVRTPPSFETRDVGVVFDWIERARVEKNRVFFDLIGAERTEKLRKK